MNPVNFPCPRCGALWNAAGRVTFVVGSALHRVGLALCGLAGDLDARADLAGYWDGRTR